MNSKSFWFIILNVVCCVLLILFLAGSFGLMVGFLSKNIYLIAIGILIIGIVLYMLIRKGGYKHGK